MSVSRPESTRPEGGESTELVERLRPALLRVSRLLRREAGLAGVSALDALLLGQINKNPGITASELAEREHMTRPTMSGHVTRLEEAGWVSRGACASEDRRRISLTITKKGERALAEIKKHRSDWLAARLATLSPAQLQALEQSIEPLLALVKEEK
jgi:DNA-binding MarR family transcriptional regulator